MRPADCLVGLDLPGGWHVDSIIHRPPTSTGGKFSVGYSVTGHGGKKAFLKAMDFSSAFNEEDPPRALEPMITAYNFERDLLNKCKDRHLKRIVTPLADGSINVPGNFGPLGNVPYVIFELASKDIRAEVASWNQFDLAWALRSLHHTATGINQLHSAGIAHQDLKPSNVLIFPVDGSKIADLGRASYIHATSRADKYQIPGDVGYAPPEQIYGWNHSPEFNVRYVADLYQLGSLVYFYFMKTSASAALRIKLIKLHPNSSFNNFISDLPYLQQAFSESITDLDAALTPIAGLLKTEIITIVQQLCEPDPRRRGDPNAKRSGRHQHDAQAYISRFDRLATKAELGIL